MENRTNAGYTITNAYKIGNAEFVLGYNENAPSPYLYITMLMKGTLNEHLWEIDQTAKQQVEQLVQQMAKSEGINEELKAKDQMKWVRLMNNLRHSAEESVIQELINN